MNPASVILVVLALVAVLIGLRPWRGPWGVAQFTLAALGLFVLAWTFQTWWPVAHPWFAPWASGH